MAKAKQAIILTEKQRRILSKLHTSHAGQYRYKLRAKIILDSADHRRTKDTLAELNIVASTVGKWRDRWNNASEKLACIERDEIKGIEYERAICDILDDLPREGTPAKFSAEQICKIISVACEAPEKSGLPLSHWSLPSLAAELVKRQIVDSISTSQLHVFLKSGRYKAP